jgi:hypothetical protein
VATPGTLEEFFAAFAEDARRLGFVEKKCITVQAIDAASFAAHAERIAETVMSALEKR